MNARLTLLALLVATVLGAAPSRAEELRVRLGEAAQSAFGDRLARLEDRLRGRADALRGTVRPDREDELLEEQATDLTEYRALELEGWSPDGLDGDRARECARAREERQREIRTRREELDRARESLAEAENDREEENARARLARQREHLHRELSKSEEILGRVCGAQPPGLREDFVPPGREEHPVFGEYFRKGPPTWAGDPDHPDHPRNRDKGVDRGEKRGGEGKGKGEGRGRGRGGK